ncbi:MAG: LCP family protein [Actinomycetota bacterium]|nr:MAG: cell envelope-related transcriptional [Actinomycetota bacterium]MDP3630422.1 LCP family protein [Actinomycetota bacterium]
MGKHVARTTSRRRGAARPAEVERLAPASTSSESRGEQLKRRSRLDYGERRRRVVRRKRVALGCLAIFLILACAGAATAFFYVRGLDNNMQKSFKTDVKANTALDKPASEKKDQPFYMILMGVDSREIGEASRSDTIIVVRVDPPQQRITLISIPRDTRVRIPGHGTTKINAAHAYGGPALVIETIKEVTGLPIAHYAEVDFKGFKDVVDALGGVTVDVPEDIYDIKAANHVKAAARISAGVQKLDGGKALTFVRSRAFPRGDLQRVENQQTFLKAVLDQTLQPGNILRLPSVVSAMAKSSTTDMSVGDMVRIADQMKGMKSGDLEGVTMPGEPKMISGISYVVMDTEGFAKMLERVKSGQPAEASNLSTATAEPAQITVAVRNGAGLEGVANDASSRVGVLGFDVQETGNMNQFVYKETLIVYKKDKKPAQLLAEMLGKGRVVASNGVYSFDTDVLLVVGKDWGPLRPRRTNQIPIR